MKISKKLVLRVREIIRYSFNPLTDNVDFPRCFKEKSSDVGILRSARYGFSIVFGCRYKTQFAYCYVFLRFLLKINAELWTN